MNVSEETRLVVIGHPGAGKTTFVKHIVYKWAKSTGSRSNERNATLHRFLFVFPIILRLVKPGSTLMDILIQQLPLNKLDICIIQHVLKQSSQLMFVFDGYDEITCQGIIQKVIRKEEFPNATVIITTRPHGLPLIQQLGYGAVQMVVEIIGFNSKQIQIYIEKFMKANMQQDQDKLFRHLSKNERLLKLAESPTRLEIICFVWLTRGDLGEKLSDLYQTFLISLLKHMERKNLLVSPLEKISDKGLLQKYHKFLMKLSEMANTWDENGNLQAIFGHDQLVEHLGDDLETAKQLGCIMKYNPSKSEETSDWSFTHLTLQYYFIAYFLSQSTDIEAGQFAKRHSPIELMDTIKGIMQFLCSMKADTANTILQCYAKMVSLKKECLKLQKFICQLVNEYKTIADINIPLPEYILWTQEQDTKSLMILSHSDKTNKHRNMKYLDVKRLTNAMNQIDLSYVPNVYMKLRHPEEFQIMANSIKTASELKQLELVASQIDHGHDEFETLLFSVPKGINELRVSGYKVLKPVSKVVSSLQCICRLHIKDNTENTGQVESCLSEAISCFTDTDVSVKQELLDSSLFSTPCQGILNLNFFGTRKEDLDELNLKTMKLDNDSMSNVKSLNLSGKISRQNDLSSQGGAIGLILTKLLKMETLKMDFCKFDEVTLCQMIDRLAEKNISLSLKCLTMNGNRLKNGGAKLGQFLNFSPELERLELSDSQLEDADFNQITRKQSLIPKLQQLNVSGNVFQEKSSMEFCGFLHNKSKLTVINLGWCNLDASTTDSIFKKTRLQKLEQLDLRFNHLGGGGLRSLAYHLSEMPSLKILNLSRCGCSNADELVMLCGCIPPTMEELDVRSNLFDKDIIKVSYIFSK